MVFTSYEFVLVFLPIVLLAVLGASALGQRTAAKLALLAGSLTFYAWWNPQYVVLLVVALAFNFVVGRWLIDTRAARELATRRVVVLVVALCVNIGALVYFKYTGFLLDALGDATGEHFSIAPIVLPLGISFIVFQKIAFLVDAYSGQIARLPVLDYALFVTFFPQLISGPIVHHREVIPQFEAPTSLRYSPRLVAIAIAFLVFGAFKKTIVADSLSPHVAAAFDGAATGTPLGTLAAWAGALAYTLQVYFDFSGYSDMAIGLGLLFGVRLPFNFNSPLKATSPIDYWTRWHITLTRFLTAYIYNPLVKRTLRRRMASRKPITVDGVMTLGAFVRLLAWPTLITMFVAGAWHGAGFQFIVFGLVHGGYLVANHAWRNWRGDRDDAAPTRAAIGAGRLATFVAVVLAIPFFRAASASDGWSFVSSMFGAHGLGAHAVLRDHELVGLLVAFVLASQLLPNTQEILRDRLDAATSTLVKHPGEARPSPNWSWPRLAWRPTLAWAVVLGIAGWYVVLKMARPSEFLYFQF